MGVQVVVQPVGPRVHERLQPVRARRVLGPHLVRVDEELHPEISVDRLLPLGLGQATHGVEEVRLDPVEVVLGLGVHEPEDGVGVRIGVDVGDAPVVADDGDPLGLFLPRGRLGVRGLGRGARDPCGHEEEHGLSHEGRSGNGTDCSGVIDGCAFYGPPPHVTSRPPGAAASAVTLRADMKPSNMNDTSDFYWQSA